MSFIGIDGFIKKIYETSMKGYYILEKNYFDILATKKKWFF